MKRFISALIFSTMIILLAMSQFSCGSSPSGRQRESLSLFPFTGSSTRDGEAIIASLARQTDLRRAFTSVTPLTQAARESINYERRIQRDSNLTDPDTIFEIGREINAAFVLAGFITSLGDRNIVIVSILDVESLQQVAGDYRVYRSIEEIDRLIPDMARKLADSAMRDTSRLPGLSVPPFSVSSEISQSDAQVLSQILACELANANKYAVLPRTDNLDTIMEEHQRQRADNEEELDRVRRLGRGRNARYVLSGSVQSLGNLNKIAADIFNIENGSMHDGYEENYSGVSQGIEHMQRLAARLNGVRYVSSAANTQSQTDSPAQIAVIPNEPLNPNIRWDNDSSGDLTIRNGANDNLVLFAGRVSDNNLLGGVRRMSTRRVDFYNKVTADNGQFLLRAVKASVYDSKGSDLNNEDVVFAYLVIYNKNAPSRQLINIPHHVSGSAGVTLSNETNTAVQIRVNRPNGPVLTTLGPHEIGKRVNMEYNSIGYILFPVYQFKNRDSNVVRSVTTQSLSDISVIIPAVDDYSSRVNFSRLPPEAISPFATLIINNQTNLVLSLVRGGGRMTSKNGNQLFNPGSETYELNLSGQQSLTIGSLSVDLGLGQANIMRIPDYTYEAENTYQIIVRQGQPLNITRIDRSDNSNFRIELFNE
ncbi:MAG: penicillin-binding protein activator LpoB [Treponema sp.]|nr:penicillin-binding protein activator LpoB [Treponema sp.]